MHRFGSEPVTALAEVALLHAFLAAVILTGLHHAVAAAVRTPAMLSSHHFTLIWYMPQTIIGIYHFVKRLSVWWLHPNLTQRQKKAGDALGITYLTRVDKLKALFQGDANYLDVLVVIGSPVSRLKLGSQIEVHELRAETGAGVEKT